MRSQNKVMIHLSVQEKPVNLMSVHAVDNDNVLWFLTGLMQVIDKFFQL